MQRIISIIVFLLFTSLVGFCGSSSAKRDSILAIIHSHKEDTIKAKAMLDMYQFIDDDPANKDYVLVKDGYALSFKLHYNWGIKTGLTRISISIKKHGEIELGLAFCKRGMEIADSLKSDSTKADLLNVLGLMYDISGDFPRSIDSYQKCLAIEQATGNKKLEAMVLNNIGVVYRSQANWDKALEFFEQSKKIREELNDQKGIASSYNNIATVFGYKKDLKRALEYANKALEIRIKLNDRSGISVCYGNIGGIYDRMKEYRKAVEFYTKALKIQTELHSQSFMITSLLNLAGLYDRLNDPANAVMNYLQAIKLAKETGSSDLLMAAYTEFSVFYKGQNDFQHALDYHLKATELKDSIFSEKNRKQVNELEQKYQSDKKDKEIKIKNLEAQQKDEQLGNQKMFSYFITAGLFLALALVFFIFRGYKQKQKANLLLESQKKEIAHQKELVDEKNSEILDSIHYAKKIQSAILPGIDDAQNFLGESFILFRPKDIVSGDFYWITQKEEFTFYVAADCTGHGVPGGFMSMLGTALLNEVVNENRIFEPAKILDQLRIKIILALKQKGLSGENKDGMDMCLVRLNKTRNELVYAAANNSLYIVRHKLITDHKGDKQPVGISGSESKDFTQHTIALQKGDCIYTFTDGYADQFGGPKGKKFKYKQLEELLTANASLSMSEQKQLLETKLLAWKGDFEQVDDVCVIGVRI